MEPPEKDESKALATIGYLDKAMLPVRTSTLIATREKLKDPIDAELVEALIAITRSDPALFRMCVAALAPLRPENDRAGDLLSFLRTLPVEKVHEIFEELVNRLQSIPSTAISGAERKQLERTAVRCVAAQKFAAIASTVGHQVDEAVAHAASYFSEIGHTLIAARYPHILARVKKENPTTSKRDLGIAIKRQIGITPEAVGVHLARQAGIPSMVIREIQTLERAEDKPADELTPLGAAIRSGEIMADIHESNGAINAYEAWRQFAPVLEVFLGNEGADRFSDEVNHALAPILAELGSIKTRDELPEKSIFENTEDSALRITRNRFLPRCEAGTRKEIERIYGLMTDPGPSPAALRELLSVAMGRAGFIGGAVFRHYETSQEFRCLLRLGSRSADIYSPNRVFSRWEFSLSREGTQAIRLEFGAEDGKLIDCLFARFSSGEVSGVLVLELAPALYGDRQYAMNHFSALRVTLEECLR